MHQNFIPGTRMVTFSRQNCLFTGFFKENTILKGFFSTKMPCPVRKKEDTKRSPLAYILKAKQLAEFTFQVKILAEKVRKSRQQNFAKKVRKS